jgi:mannose-1-phosphate guanylyltransferase/mannose-6-phosphate isomerase
VRQARRDSDFVRLEEAAFLSCPSRSIDHAVMEHTDKAAVVPATMGWSDVGSWQSLWEIAGHMPDGNVVLGEVVMEGARGSYLRSEGPLVAAIGIEDMVVVATSDAVLVSRRDRVQDVKKIVDRLKVAGSDRHVQHALVRRPWGTYENIDSGTNFLVKRITVNSGQRLSLQMHHHRAEHWVVVQGTALATCGERQITLQPGETAYIPQGARHRLENSGQTPLVLIEVQFGAHLSEEDIVRFEDIYGRVSAGK